MTQNSLLLALALAAAPCVHAQTDNGIIDTDGTRWGVGIGASLQLKPYRDIDDKPVALPLLMAENRWISLRGNTLDLKLPSTEWVQFRLRATYLFDGYEADDSPDLQGMADRKSSAWLGAAVKVRAGVVNVWAEALGDVGDKSKGSRARLGLDHDFVVGDVRFTPRVGAQWLDRKTVDYYYGVTAGEATASRGAYAGRATTNAEVGVRIGYAVTPRHSLMLDVGTTGFGKGIKDSPLVERSSQTDVQLGYVYMF